MSNPFKDMDKPKPCPKGYLEEIIVMIITKFLKIQEIRSGK